MIRLRRLARELTPPIVPRLVRAVGRRRHTHPEWEYIAEGWSYAQHHPEVRGWDVEEIADVYKRKWPRFAQFMAGSGPLGVDHQSALTTRESLIDHNASMIYGYVLALAARHKTHIRLLDWGGGCGHYYLLARALLPGVAIDYHCRDLPQLSALGAQLFPAQTFFADDRWRDRTYEMVMASSALQYAQDWQALVRELCEVTGDFLYITASPIVRHVPSFVFIQRPYQHGYNTEYLGWCLNEQELLQTVSAAGLVLRREFVHGFRPVIRGAPEQNAYRGYLFQRQAAG